MTTAAIATRSYFEHFGVVPDIFVEQYRGVDAIKEREVYFDPAAHKKPNTYFYRGLDYATIQW